MRQALLVAMAVSLLASCEREQRTDREHPAARVGPLGESVTELVPGEPRQRARLENPYEGQVHAMNDGRRLYSWFNCDGCHFAGGGGMGPALMDDKWIYGSAPANVFASIMEGRPNGMPAFRGRIPANDVWKIVSYVRSLSGLETSLPKGARSLPLQRRAPRNKEKRR